MIEESVYSKKFARLEPVSEVIFNGIKKEIKKEMTVKGSSLQRKLGIFSIKEPKEMRELFLKNIVSLADDELGEWVASAWINRHGEIFQCFHEHLIKVSEKYDELTTIPPVQEEALMKDVLMKFGALNVYVFCVLNSVVISAENLYKLEVLAQEELKSKKVAEETISESSVSVEELQKKFEEQMQKVLEKQEKKFLGITERHQMEIAGYRKQISQLQKKLEGLGAGSR